jgi:hypothetical protein
MIVESTYSMKKTATLYLMSFVLLLLPSSVLAQAFGEYGRAVGSVPRGKGITGSGPSGGGSHGNVSGGGVGDLGGRALPVRLVVAAKNAGLFPRQDDESEKIAQLTEGENLVPMVQSEGTNQWFMVRTQKGLVGWVKSVDVRQEKTKH